MCRAPRPQRAPSSSLDTSATPGQCGPHKSHPSLPSKLGGARRLAPLLYMCNEVHIYSSICTSSLQTHHHGPLLPQGEASEGVSAHLQACYQRRSYQTGPTQTLRLVMPPALHISNKNQGGTFESGPPLSSHAAKTGHGNGNGMSTPWCPAAAMPAEHAQSDQSTAAAPSADATEKKQTTATTSAHHRGAAERTLRMFAARPSNLAGILQAGATIQLSTSATASLGYTTTGPWPEHDATSSGHPWTPPKPCSPPCRKAFFNLTVADKTACARATWWRIDWLK